MFIHRQQLAVSCCRTTMARAISEYPPCVWYCGKIRNSFYHVTRRHHYRTLWQRPVKFLFGSFIEFHYQTHKNALSNNQATFFRPVFRNSSLKNMLKIREKPFFPHSTTSTTNTSACILLFILTEKSLEQKALILAQLQKMRGKAWKSHWDKTVREKGKTFLYFSAFSLPILGEKLWKLCCVWSRTCNKKAET